MKSLIKMKEGVRYVPINTVWYLKLSPGQCQNFKPLRSTNDVSNHNSFENPKSFFTSSVPLHGGSIFLFITKSRLQKKIVESLLSFLLCNSICIMCVIYLPRNKSA